MTQYDADVLVVGGGLSGLTAAHRLALRGLAVEVVDAGAQPGGVIATRRRAVPGGEAVYELGPNSGMDTSPLVNEVLRDLGILALRRDAERAASKRYILRRGRPQPVPASLAGFIATPLFSAGAKLRLLREPFVPRYDYEHGPEESIAAFVRRRLGPELLDYAVEPFVGGVYAGNAEALSLPASFPPLAALEREHGGLLRGALLGARARRRAAAARGETAKPRATSFNFRDGMQTLTDALAQHSGRMTSGARAVALRREADGFVVTVEQGDAASSRRARALLLAVPAFDAAPLVAHWSAAAAAALGAIEYPPVATVSTAYRRHEIRHPLDGFGFLAPRVEQAAVLGTLFTSSMFAGRTPAGVVLLTSFVGGWRDPQAALAPDEHVAAEVVRANDRYLGGGAPLFSTVHKWPRAIPQYNLGHQQRLAAVDALERQVPGLQVFGNWRDGVSIADCIKAGCAQAERAAAALAAAHGV